MVGTIDDGPVLDNVSASALENAYSPKGVLDMRISALIIVLALLVVPGVAPANNDTLVWDIAAGPQYVDPVMGTSAQANVMVLQNVYERLVWYDGPGTQPIPWLATGWEVKDAGRRYVFKLRK